MKSCLIISILLLQQLSWVMAQPSKPEEKVVYLPDSVPLHFVLIPAGDFLMGSPENENDRGKDEGPQHQVIISKPFYLGKYEVTQEQWASLMRDNPAVFQQPPTDLLRPVESVSWQSCQQFIQKLNALGLGTFRLPTEAEWEYACRAGTKSPYYWGDNANQWEINQYAWVNSRSFATTHAVGGKRPNPWGLYDMNGNVWEWCSDWYGPYADEPQTDPGGPVEGKERVFRGGSWYDFPDAQRSANRHRHAPEGSYTAIGFRLLMEVND